MTTRDKLLGLTVAILWGLNFLAIRAGLNHFPPFFFAGLRFLVIAIPVLLFVPRPKVPLKWLLLYGFGFGFLQFAFLFSAMNLGMPTGLASLVLQSSAPFTVILGALLLRERVGRRQWIGIGVAIGGMVLIGWDRAVGASLLPVILTLLAGLGWAFGNLGSRLAVSSRPASGLPVSSRPASGLPVSPRPMHLMLWMAVVPPLPMLALSAIVEGPTTGWAALGTSFSSTGWTALAGLAFIVGPATIVGSGIWTYLMGRYSAGTVAPFSLLVPVVGIGASFLFLNEVPTVVSLIGAVIVIGGCLGGLSRQHRPAAPDPVQPASEPPKICHASADFATKLNTR
ncbi:EamA family transporter [Actinomycetes bacterium M1A6_2h]